MDVFVFRGVFNGHGDSAACVARRGEVEALLGPDALDAIFFGHVEYAGERDERFVGVWGARNAARLRRLLRERGAELAPRREPPPARLRLWSTQGRARAEARRAARLRSQPTDRAPPRGDAPAAP